MGVVRFASLFFSVSLFLLFSVCFLFLRVAVRRRPVRIAKCGTTRAPLFGNRKVTSRPREKKTAFFFEKGSCEQLSTKAMRPLFRLLQEKKRIVGDRAFIFF
jgi:hypothetical protein